MPAAVRERPRERGRLSRPASAALAAGLISFGVYLYTLAPTVLDGDDGELVAAAHVLGIPHPTGYPLYMLLAKLFTLLPVGTVPARVAFFSAISAAGAVAAIAWATATLARSAPAGVLAGVIAGFNEPMWSQATRAEVYALNALIVAVSTAVFVHSSAQRRPAGVVWLALLCGLGLAHHRTSAFFTVPMLAGAIILSRPRLGDLLRAGCVGALPLLLYLYIPIRATARPPIMWYDLPAWELLKHEISGGGYYQLFAFARPGAEMVEVAVEFAKDTAVQLTGGGLALAMLGFVVLSRRHRSVSACLFAGVTLLGVWNLGYYVYDWHVFFIPTYLVAGMWAGVGVAALSDIARSTLSSRSRAMIPLVTGLLVTFVLMSLLQRNWSSSNHRREWEYYDVAHAVLAQLPPGAVCVAVGYEFNMIYLQVVEGERPDVLVVPAFGQMTSRITDGRIRSLVPSLAAEHTRWASYRQLSTVTQAALSLSKALAVAIDWSRPIYCNTDCLQAPADPLVRTLWWNLFHITDEQVEMLAPRRGDSTIQEFGDGISLVGATVEPDAVRPRELTNITLDWTCAEPVAQAPFVAVRLSPAGEGGASRRGMMQDYRTWLSYGMAPLLPTPSGSVYRQHLAAMVPTNALPGKWHIWTAVAPDPNVKEAFWKTAEFEVLPAE